MFMALPFSSGENYLIQSFCASRENGPFISLPVYADGENEMFLSARDDSEPAFLRPQPTIACRVLLLCGKDAIIFERLQPLRRKGRCANQRQL